MKYTTDLRKAQKWQQEEGGTIRWSEEHQAFYISVF